MSSDGIFNATGELFLSFFELGDRISSFFGESRNFVVVRLITILKLFFVLGIDPFDFFLNGVNHFLVFVKNEGDAFGQFPE